MYPCTLHTEDEEDEEDEEEEEDEESMYSVHRSIYTVTPRQERNAGKDWEHFQICIKSADFPTSKQISLPGA